MIGFGPVPAPSVRYDRENEAAFRRQIELVVRSILQELRFAGNKVEGATLQIVNGIPTWVEPTP